MLWVVQRSQFKLQSEGVTAFRCWQFQWIVLSHNHFSSKLHQSFYGLNHHRKKMWMKLLCFSGTGHVSLTYKRTEFLLLFKSLLKCYDFWKGILWLLYLKVCPCPSQPHPIPHQCTLFLFFWWPYYVIANLPVVSSVRAVTISVWFAILFSARGTRFKSHGKP